MSKNNMEKIRKIEESVNLILTKKYGETVETKDLEAIIGYKVSDEIEKRKFASYMRKIKDILVDKGYILKSVTGVGYYILKPKHIASYCYRTYIDKTKTLLEKSDRILTHIDQTELSDERKIERDYVHTLNSELQGKIEQSILTSSYYENKEYYDNLND